jgi:hypothetical protein
MKTAQEIKDEIEALTKQLNGTRREWRVDLTFFIDACNEAEVEKAIDEITPAIRNAEGCSISVQTTETGS